MKKFHVSALKISIQIVIGIFIPAMVTFVMHPAKELLGSQIVALIYLLPVLFSGYFLGLLPAIVTSVTAFLCLNYFFIPPYFSFLVHKGQDFVTLLVFLLISVFTSQLIAKARKGTLLAQQHELEATNLYKLLLALSARSDAISIAETLAEHTMKTINCRRLKITVQPSTGKYPIILEKTENESAGGNSFEFTYPMLSARGNEGNIQVWIDHPVLSGDEDRLFSMYVAQGAQALERARLMAVETRAQILEETDQVKKHLACFSVARIAQPAGCDQGVRFEPAKRPCGMGF